MVILNVTMKEKISRISLIVYAVLLTLSGFLASTVGGKVGWFCIMGIFAIPPIVAGPKRYRVLGIIALLIAIAAAGADYHAGKRAWPGNRIDEFRKQHEEKSKSEAAFGENNTFVSSVERAIKSGDIGADIAERAKKTGNLYLREVANTGIPYKVFRFSDYLGGYTVMVEDNHLVLLCAGFGGGEARDFMIKKENGKEVLSYRFDVGSGVTHELSGRYVIGSGRATWDTLGTIKPQQSDSPDAAGK